VAGSRYAHQVLTVVSSLVAVAQDRQVRVMFNRQGKRFRQSRELPSRVPPAEPLPT
jgi:hypothetical protein